MGQALDILGESQRNPGQALGILANFRRAAPGNFFPGVFACFSGAQRRKIFKNVGFTPKHKISLSRPCSLAITIPIIMILLYVPLHLARLNRNKIITALALTIIYNTINYINNINNTITIIIIIMIIIIATDNNRNSNNATYYQWIRICTITITMPITVTVTITIPITITTTITIRMPVNTNSQ